MQMFCDIRNTTPHDVTVVLDGVTLTIGKSRLQIRVLVPGELVRDEQGNIKGCKGFVLMEP